MKQLTLVAAMAIASRVSGLSVVASPSPAIPRKRNFLARVEWFAVTSSLYGGTDGHKYGDMLFRTKRSLHSALGCYCVASGVYFRNVVLSYYGYSGSVIFTVNFNSRYM